ncbi:MAG: DNA topoisomerase 3 [Bacteriovoracaceae bacterium]|nr:DNA topoisomerase 3 [Bacteriovoracaceae bacterium]
MKSLILTEKPSVARDFALALSVKNRGDGYFESEIYIITWAIGHLLTPYNPEDYDLKWKKWTLQNLPIIPNTINYRPNPGTKKQLGIVIKLLKRDDIKEIVVATDAGREGELIARTILHYAKVNKNSFRFWTSDALNSNIIKREMQKRVPLKDYDNLFFAGRSRQIADWLVGMNLSRLASLKLGDLFSIGRVQTAVLSFLVDRRIEIERFIPKDYWKIKAKFTFDKKGLDAYWFDPTKKEEKNKLTNEELANKIIQKLTPSTPAEVSDVSKVEKYEKSPPLFSLTDLQRMANKRFGFSAKKTLDLAQNLYEKYKCLSYPRSDARVLGQKSFDLASSLLGKFYHLHPSLFEKFDRSKLNTNNKHIFNDDKLTDHHALIPLDDFKGPANCDEAKIFDLVLRRFIMVFSKDHCFQETKITITCNDELFQATGKAVREVGWKFLDLGVKEKLLPCLQKSQIGKLKKALLESKKTLPPQEYSEATLLKDMINPSKNIQENNLKKIFRGEIGLGTQATRAQIIETLITRNYIIRQKRNLIATKKGVFLIDHLQTMGTTKIVASPKETAVWELKLEKIKNGKSSHREFLDEIKSFVNKSCVEWKQLSNSALPTPPKSSTNSSKLTNTIPGSCPICTGELIESKKAYGCSKWQAGCKFTVWKKIAGKQITKPQFTQLLASGSTDLLEGWLSKQGTQFSARLTISEGGKVTFKYV